jgi:hypothetical protein
VEKTLKHLAGERMVMSSKSRRGGEGLRGRTGNKPKLVANLCFIYQHDRDVVFDGIDALALDAFKSILIRGQFDGLLTQRANEDFQKF